MESPDFRSKTNKFLINILRNYPRYSEAEVKAAYDELLHRGIIDQVIAQLRKERKQQIPKNLYTSGIKPGTPINLSRCKTFRIGSLQQVLFEQRLIAENIPYLRREGLDAIVPVVNYYFTDDDFPVVDQIEIETEEYVQNQANRLKVKPPRKALRSFLWIGLFFLFFVLFTLLFRWLWRQF